MTNRDPRLAFIDELILEAVRNGNRTFEAIFLHVGRNFGGARPEPFFSVVERRQQALRRKGLISFDRSAQSWKIVAKELSAV
jgi:hypothetical protein